MNTLNVRIVQLEPLRVATAYGFGEGPERIAWDKMIAWLKAKGLWQDGRPRRFFGFDQPSPTLGSPNYGYEVWVTVGPEVQSEGEITVRDVPGGQYAVAHCAVQNPWEDIPTTWKQLVAWAETSPYRAGRGQCLEETFFEGDPDFQHFSLDLYLPVA